MGDPAGIGPEIVLKALADNSLRGDCEPVIIGDLDSLIRTADEVGVETPIHAISPEDTRNRVDDLGLRVIDLKNVPSNLQIGTESAAGGAASGQYIETAVGLCQKNLLDAIATAPINKRSLNAGGYQYPGHTEFIAELTRTETFAMSFFAGSLRVVLLSTHVSLSDAIELVTTESLVRLIRFSDEQLRVLLGRKVRIAVAGINPHASEGGLFGTEESESIEPAVEQCRSEGIHVAGPFSADTIYIRGYKGEFDAVIACYHDQATIAVKCLSFGEAVNVTLGLPIIRTSVDHGTAYEIAGKNLAESGSMKTAIALAAELSSVRAEQHD